MPYTETSLDEFLEVANEAVISSKKSVNTLLARSERVLTRKLKTKGDCEDYLQIIKSEGDKFNECLKVLANTRKKYDAGKMSKEDFNSTIKNAIVLLKKNCQHLQIRLGNVVEDTKAVTTKELEDFKQFLQGLKKIVQNRLRYLNARPATESFLVNDEENFAQHFIFAKEGDGTELEDLSEEDEKDKDSDEDKDKKKKSKTKTCENGCDDEDCECNKGKKKSKTCENGCDDEDCECNDDDDSESGFKDGKDPEDKDDDDDDKKKKSKSKKSKKDDEKDKDSDDDDDDEEDEDADKADEGCCKESAIIDKILDNYAYNTAEYGVESALDQFYKDLDYIDALESTSASVAKAKAFSQIARANSGRVKKGEPTMESTLFDTLLDNYAYNAENFGLEAACGQLDNDIGLVSANESGAIIAGTPGSYTMTVANQANWLDNAIGARLNDPKRVEHDVTKSIEKKDAKKMLAISSKMAKLQNKMIDADSAKKKEKITKKMKRLQVEKDAINAARKASGCAPITLEAAMSLVSYDDECRAYEEAIDRILDNLTDEALEGDKELTLAPGDYRFGDVNDEDSTHFIRKAFDRRINDPERIEAKTKKIVNKQGQKVGIKDAKKLSALGRKIAKLELKKSRADSEKSKVNIDSKIKKLKGASSAINLSRKAAGYDELSLESALAMLGANYELDPEYIAYENAIDDMLDSDGDADTLAIQFACYSAATEDVSSDSTSTDDDDSFQLEAFKF